jgi:hypothetical protein
MGGCHCDLPRSIYPVDSQVFQELRTVDVMVPMIPEKEVNHQRSTRIAHPCLCMGHEFVRFCDGEPS